MRLLVSELASSLSAPFPVEQKTKMAVFKHDKKWNLQKGSKCNGNVGYLRALCISVVPARSKLGSRHVRRVESRSRTANRCPSLWAVYLNKLAITLMVILVALSDHCYLLGGERKMCEFWTLAQAFKWNPSTHSAKASARWSATDIFWEAVCR